MSLETTRQRLSTAPRCPACHEGLELGQPALICPAGHAAIHADCLELSPVCPVLGCEAALVEGAASVSGRAFELSAAALTEISERQQRGRTLLLAGALLQAEQSAVDRNRTLAMQLLLISAGAVGIVGSVGGLCLAVAALPHVLLICGYLGHVGRRRIRGEVEDLVAELGGQATTDVARAEWRARITSQSPAVIAEARRLAARMRRNPGPRDSDALALWGLVGSTVSEEDE